MFETALEEGEIVTAVKFTAPDQCGYSKFPNPASRYALTGVFVARRGGRRCGSRSRVPEMTACSAPPEIEEALGGKFRWRGGWTGAVGFPRRPDVGHPRLGRVPRQSGGGDGQACGGSCEQLTSLQFSTEKASALPGPSPF